MIRSVYYQPIIHSNIDIYIGSVHLQHSRIAIASACWKFLLFLNMQALKQYLQQVELRATIHVCFKNELTPNLWKQ